MVGIIIKDKEYRLGKTRSEVETNIRKEGWSTLSNSQLDKCKYLEKKFGSKVFFGQNHIDKAR